MSCRTLIQCKLFLQPYRTTPLIQPGAKPRPDLLNQKVIGVGRSRKPASFRPFDEQVS